jgi:hypothetical protein
LVEVARRLLAHLRIHVWRGHVATNKGLVGRRLKSATTYIVVPTWRRHKWRWLIERRRVVWRWLH